jgi:hypothetical protein
MNKKLGLIIAGIVLLLGVTGFVVYKALVVKPTAPVVEDIAPLDLPLVASSVTVDLAKSKTETNTVVISVSGMGSTIASIAYELTYDSQGLIKGVNSGSKPADVSGKDTFERPIYLGTCSRNVCKPDVGVSKVTLNLVFTDSSGKQSQFSKDYTL